MSTLATGRVPSQHSDYEQLVGKSVYSSDGERLGDVAAVLHPEGAAPLAIGKHCLVVMPGVVRSLFGADVVYVPETTVQAVHADRVVLIVPSDSLAAQGWLSRPAGNPCVHSG
jgi:sporulation protein YlmC with PRC-barrel domain